VALFALLTGTEAEDVHESWQASFAQAYIDACMGEFAGETFTYLFTCVLP